MSYAISVTFKNERALTSADWNSAIAKAGFDLVLGPLDAAAQAGFLPVRMMGMDTGFEFLCEQLEGSGKVTMILHAAHFELTAAMAALSALQSATDGSYGDDDGRRLTGAETTSEARNLYWGTRVVLAHLRTAEPSLPNDLPSLDRVETLESRRSVLDSLVQQRVLVAETIEGATRYRLHRIRRKELLAELLRDEG